MGGSPFRCCGRGKCLSRLCGASAETSVGTSANTASAIELTGKLAEPALRAIFDRARQIGIHGGLGLLGQGPGGLPSHTVKKPPAESLPARAGPVVSGVPSQQRFVDL